MDSSPKSPDAALPPMALLATLQTAASVWDGVRERRAGRDPAGQEPAGRARAYLTAAARELTRLHMQMLMAKVQAERSAERDAGRQAEKRQAEKQQAEKQQAEKQQAERESIRRTPGDNAPKGNAPEGNAPEGNAPEGNAPEGDAPPSARLTATVRYFDLLMKLRRTGRLLHGTHQRLLSLYPAVSEELVEEARRSQRALAVLQDAGSARGAAGFDEALSVFLQQLLSFTAWLEREL